MAVRLGLNIFVSANYNTDSGKSIANDDIDIIGNKNASAETLVDTGGSSSVQDALPRAFYAIIIIIGIVVESLVISEVVEKLYEKYLQRLADKHRAEKVVQLLKEHSVKPPSESVQDVATCFRKNVVGRRLIIINEANNSPQQVMLHEELNSENGQDQIEPSSNNDYTNIGAIPLSAADIGSDAVTSPLFSSLTRSTTTPEETPNTTATIKQPLSISQSADGRQKFEEVKKRFTYPKPISNNPEPIDDLQDESNLKSDTPGTVAESRSSARQRQYPIGTNKNSSNQQRNSGFSSELSVHVQ